MKKLKAITLFASSGIGEFFLEGIGIDVIASNEIVPRRCELYKALYPNTVMICGDIKDNKIKSKLKGYTLIITPRYVPSVLTDIEGDDVSILLASTFTEYLYQLIKSKNTETDYTDLHNLILENTGTDISSLVSNLTFEKFGS